MTAYKRQDNQYFLLSLALKGLDAKLPDDSIKLIGKKIKGEEKKGEKRWKDRSEEKEGKKIKRKEKKEGEARMGRKETKKEWKGGKGMMETTRKQEGRLDVTELPD